MNVIQTSYSGYLFRSRTEARWAVFFDALCEPWEYEREGYELRSGRYLPDFWLPRLHVWLEIKGERPTPEAIHRCEELAYSTETPVAIAWGLPYAVAHDQAHWTGDWVGERLRVFCSDITDSSGGTQWWDDCFWALDQAQRLCVCSADTRDDREFLMPEFGSHFAAMKLMNDIISPVPHAAIDAAKSARFEAGR